MQEDIETAFEKLVSPVVKHVCCFCNGTRLCERSAYVSIKTTVTRAYHYTIKNIMTSFGCSMEGGPSKK